MNRKSSIVAFNGKSAVKAPPLNTMCSVLAIPSIARGQANVAIKVISSKIDSDGPLPPEVAIWLGDKRSSSA